MGTSHEDRQTRQLPQGKGPVYGMNDASRRWWNFLDKALRSNGMVPTRADRCCSVLHFLQRASKLGNTGYKGPSHSRTAQKTPSLNHVSDQKWKLNLKKTLDPRAGSPATGKSMARIINLFVEIDLFGTNGNGLEQRVLTRLKKDFEVGSEDWNDVALTRQRTRWTQDSLKTGRPLKSVNTRLWVSWNKFQWNETRRKTSIALFQCTQCTEAYWDR